MHVQLLSFKVGPPVAQLRHLAVMHVMPAEKFCFGGPLLSAVIVQVFTRSLLRGWWSICRMYVYLSWFCLLLTLHSKTSVGACGHTTGRILRQLENKQIFDAYTPCKSKLPPLRRSYVSLVLNQNRLRTIRKTDRSYNAGGVACVSGSRRSGTLPSHCTPGKNSRRAVLRGGRGQRN